MPKKDQEGFLDRMLEWVREERRRGLTNVQILQRHTWQRYGHYNFDGYFYSLNGHKRALAAYVAPPVIWESFGWADDLFVGKKV